MIPAVVLSLWWSSLVGRQGRLAAVDFEGLEVRELDFGGACPEGPWDLVLVKDWLFR